MEYWPNGVPKSCNNAFSIPTHRAPAKYVKPANRLRLTTAQEAAISFMTKAEAKAYREQLKQKQQ